MKESSRTTIVEYQDNTPYDGKWEVRSLPTAKLALFQKNAKKRNRKAADDDLAVGVSVVEQSIKYRIIGWELDNGKPYSVEALEQLIDVKMDMLLEILSRADEQIEKDFDAEWGNS